jgi:hypothetical protein
VDIEASVDIRCMTCGAMRDVEMGSADRALIAMAPVPYETIYVETSAPCVCGASRFTVKLGVASEE